VGIKGGLSKNKKSKPHGRKPVVYVEYIKSKEWTKFANKKKRLVKGRCQACFSTQRMLTCHHINYDSLGHESLRDVLALCWSCHKDLHTMDWRERVSASCAIRSNWERFMRNRI